MRELFNIETINFWVKGIVNTIQNVNTRLGVVESEYADLEEKYLRDVVISEELEGRQSQLVSISTTFGNADISDPSIKEFLFNAGTRLSYSRVLSASYPNTLEVCNLQTVLNILSAFADLNSEQLNGYLLKAGDNATGNFSFSAFGGANSFSFIGMHITTDADTEISLHHGEVLNVDPLNVNSIINIEYLNSVMPSSYLPQPVFISGKIAIGSDLSLISTTSTSLTNTLYYKLLSYTLWSSKFGANPITSIPGHALPSASGTVPYPVTFKLYMEYTIESPGSPFLAKTTFRSEVPNDVHNDGNYFRFGVVIDADGTLGLLIKSSGMMSLPIFADIPITDLDVGLKFYLAVDGWSYYSCDYDYPDGSVANVPMISFPSSPVQFTDTQPIGGFVYKLYFKDISSIATWNSSSDDIVISTANAFCVELLVSFPVGVTSVSSTISAYDGPDVFTKTVNFNLITNPLQIVPVSLSYDYYLTTSFPVVPIGLSVLPQTLYSKGAVSWEIDAGATVGATAEFTLSGKLVVTSIAASTPNASVGIIAKDTRYYITTGTVDCASDGITLTVATGSVDVSKVVGQTIMVDHTGPVTGIIQSASGSPVVIVIDTPIAGAPFTGASFQIEVTDGKASYVVPVVMVNQDT